MQRKDVDPLDVAKALKKLYDWETVSQPNLSLREFSEKISKVIGLSDREIRNYLSLLNLTPEVQEMVSNGELGVKLASQLATVEKEKQEKVAKLLTETSTEEQAEEFICMLWFLIV